MTSTTENESAGTAPRPGDRSGSVTLHLHPPALNDEPYEARALDLAPFRPPEGPWATTASGKSVLFRASDGAAMRVSAPGERVLRLRADPAGEVDAPTTCERFGLLDPDALDPGEARVAGEGAVDAAGFGFRTDSASGDFAVELDGEPVLETVGGGVRFAAEGAEYGGWRSFATFRLAPGEQIWGFGGRIHPFCRRGSAVDVFSVKGGKNRGDYSGFPMPFFLSSRGYGVFLNNPWPHVYFDMGKTWPDHWFLATPGGEFDLYVLRGPELRRMIRDFTAMTGRMPPPAKALFGFWISSLDFDNAEALTGIGERLRSEGWPCDNVVLDGPWRGGPEFIPHYQKYRVYMNNDMEWHRDFGDGPRMVDRLHEMGYNVALHLNSRTFTEATAREGLERGVLRRHEEEVVPLLGDEAAERFYLEHLRPRIEEGVDYWWTDHSDRVGGELLPGVPSRNLFGPLWNRLLSRAMAEAGRGHRLSLSRGGGIGSQTCALPWPGDTAAGIDRFLEDIWFCLGAGLAGFPLTSVDMGGFTSPSADFSKEEANAVVFGKDNLHRRIFQSLFFVPAPRIHNNYSSAPRLPWNCPESSQGLYRAFLEERYKLAPLFYSLGLHAASTGEPILRPLFYEFQNDPATHAVDDVFMIGESLLVAPLTESGAETRRFYLPEGTWRDYWTGEAVRGGREVERPCPVDELAGLPAFAREGCILPLQAPADHLDDAPPETLRLLVYPDASGDAALAINEGPELRHVFSARRAEDGGTLVRLENQTPRQRTYALALGGEAVGAEVALEPGETREARLDGGG